MPLLVISEILGLFINTLTADVQYFLPNTEYLLEPIKIQLSKEKSFFLNFLLYFWNLHQILNSLKKEGEQHSLCISEIVECERPDYLNVWKDPIQNTLQTVDMLNGLEHWWNLKDSVFIIFFIIVGEIKLEYVSLSDIWNHRTVCWNIDCRWRDFSW